MRFDSTGDDETLKKKTGAESECDRGAGGWVGWGGEGVSIQTRCL